MFWKGEVGFQVSAEQWTSGAFADWMNGVAFAQGGVSYMSMDLTKALYGKFPWTNETSLNPSVYNAIGHVYTMAVKPDTQFFNQFFHREYWTPDMRVCQEQQGQEVINLTECFHDEHDNDDVGAQNCLAAT